MRTAMVMRLRCILGLVLLAGVSAAANAAEFVIAPLLVSLDRETRSSQIEIRNEDTQPLRVQMQAMAWTQDSEGKDQYAESDELIYFPKTLEIPPGELRIVRLGVKAPPITQEDAYRLFVEELPGAEEPRYKGASVRVFLRVGVPVFVGPIDPKPQGEMSSLQLHGGVAQATVHNTGNAHFTAEQAVLVGLARDGKELFAKPVQDRYFLAGTTKHIRAQIPRDICRQLGTLEVAVVAEKLELKRRLDVSADSCE